MFKRWVNDPPYIIIPVGWVVSTHLDLKTVNSHSGLACLVVALAKTGPGIQSVLIKKGRVGS
jgi:hypothetical protein